MPFAYPVEIPWRCQHHTNEEHPMLDAFVWLPLLEMWLRLPAAAAGAAAAIS